MLLEVQKFLLTKTFGDLEREHGVEISLDSRHGHKFSLNYNQLSSREDDVLAQQCRGLILSTGSSLFEQARGYVDDFGNKRWDVSHICPGTTQVLAYPMNRFFNYGQGSAAPINWNDPQLKTFEKLDGTLTIVYFDQIIHEWHVATRSVPEANIRLSPIVPYTFRTLFEKALSNARSVSFKDFCRELDPEKTYCYELTSPYNRIVVNYLRPELHLLAVRNKFTHQEALPEEESGSRRYVPVVHSYDLSSIDAVLNYVNERSPMEHEGLVLRDSKFQRIKVKNAAYVAYNKARDSLASSPRACLELVLAEKADDVIPYMPEEIVTVIRDIQTKLHDYIQQFNAKYTLLKEKAESQPNSREEWRKVFALTVQSAKVWETPFYQIGFGKCSNFSDFLQSFKKEGAWPASFLKTLLREIGFETLDI